MVAKERGRKATQEDYPPGHLGDPRLEGSIGGFFLPRDEPGPCPCAQSWLASWQLGGTVADLGGGLQYH